MFCWFNVKFPFRIVLDLALSIPVMWNCRTFLFGFHCSSHPRFWLSFFFFQSWIVHRSISIELSLHHLCLIISPWEVHNHCHYHRYIWTSIHAFVHYCLVYLIFSIFTPWHHILVYVYFVLTMIFMIFFLPTELFFYWDRGDQMIEKCVYICWVMHESLELFFEKFEMFPWWQYLVHQSDYLIQILMLLTLLY